MYSLTRFRTFSHLKNSVSNICTYLSSEATKAAVKWKSVAIPVAGGIAGLTALLVIMIFCYLKHRRSKEQHRREREACETNQPSSTFESQPVSFKSTEKLILMNDLGGSTEAWSLTLLCLSNLKNKFRNKTQR